MLIFLFVKMSLRMDEEGNVEDDDEDDEVGDMEEDDWYI